jgi:cation:H+ antiporter
MDSALWLIVLATGLLVAIRSSRWAVGHLTEFAKGTRIPPFVIGITLVSIGTDLPEIANSIVSSITGHGDINVGDSIGSATVQSTLVLGLLPLIAGSFPIARGRVARIGLATVASLVLGALLMLDGDLSRLDAGILIAAWALGTALVWRDLPDDAAPFVRERQPAEGRHLLLATAGLILVGLGATTAVQALTRLAEIWSMPEYLIAFVLASVGTSLPELVVEVAAVRRKQWDLAVGDAIGSSFVDSTLSIGAGPLIAPIAVTTSAVVVGSLVACTAIGLAVLTLSVRREHNWLSGATLILIFLVAYLLVAVLS